MYNDDQKTLDIPELEKLEKPARQRVVLYSHDTMGLGHIRRNLLIAKALSDPKLNLDILLFSGIKEANAFDLPDFVDCLSLPSLFKDPNGRYRARSLRATLRELIRIRTQIMKTAVANFRPDIFIVDNVPRGACLELDEVIAYLHAAGACKLVLGLRDIKDEAGVVEREWRQHKYTEFIHDYYDQIWIYGDPDLYDSVAQYGFSNGLIRRVKYTGYFDQKQRLQSYSALDIKKYLDSFDLLNQSFVLCLLGGGQDGEKVARAFAQSKYPKGHLGVIITGPQMNSTMRKELQDYQTRNANLRILDFVKEPTILLQKAKSVVAMGGYNTVSEALSFKKRTLIVPRVTPRKEQLIRAERFQALHVFDMLHPDKLSAATLTKWLTKSVSDGEDFRTVRNVNVNGLDNIQLYAQALLNSNKT